MRTKGLAVMNILTGEKKNPPQIAALAWKKHSFLSCVLHIQGEEHCLICHQSQT
jgi:hypothetical protein